MKTAMLFDDTSAVDAHNLTLREGLADQTERFCVEIRLGVGGTEHGTVDNQEVGIGGRQTILAVVDGSGHGELEQPVGLAFKCAEGSQLLLHQLQLGILLVGRVVATHI